MNSNKILITGAAGNLGGLLAEYLIDRQLNLLIHNKNVAGKLQNRPNISIFKADLAQKETLLPAFEQVDTVVHFAGVLFKSKPEKFLPTTNTLYFSNLIDVAIQQKVKRIILISFPHVEGETTPKKPATGHLEGKPNSVHAQTRLQEEKMLFEKSREYPFEAVSLRVGMVYGKGILMIDAAEWLGKHCLLGVWRKPTFIHLISKPDFLAATAAAIDQPNVSGIYHLGDEGVQTLQQFLDDFAMHKKFHKALRMPLVLIRLAAQICEVFSAIFKTKSPLTNDFITIGQVSYYGDTTRMRRELLPELTYKTYKDGLEIL